MKIFVWENCNNLTERFHPEGGVVVFAETEERARALVNGTHVREFEVARKDGTKIIVRDKKTYKIGDNEPVSYVRDCADGEEKFFIFPDAGCC